jgi:hypothetical protein
MKEGRNEREAIKKDAYVEGRKEGMKRRGKRRNERRKEREEESIITR